MALPPQNSILSRKMVGIKIIKKHTSSSIPLSYWIIILSYVFCLLLAVIRVIFKSMKSLFAPTHCSGPAGWNKEQGFPSTPQLPQKHFMQCCCCGSQDVPCLISSFSTQRCAWLSSADQSSANITAFLFVCLPFFLSHKTQSLDAAQTPVLSCWKNIWGMSPGPSFHLFLSLANLHQSVWKMWWLLLKKMILYLTSHKLPWYR